MDGLASTFVILLAAGYAAVLVLFTGTVQRLWVSLARRMPRWMLWPMTPESYESPYFFWLMRLVGVGVAIAGMVMLCGKFYPR